MKFQKMTKRRKVNLVAGFLMISPFIAIIILVLGYNIEITKIMQFGAVVICLLSLVFILMSATISDRLNEESLRKKLERIRLAKEKELKLKRE
jgi:C4-dicarboxylate transporter